MVNSFRRVPDKFGNLDYSAEEVLQRIKNMKRYLEKECKAWLEKFLRQLKRIVELKGLEELTIISIGLGSLTKSLGDSPVLQYCIILELKETFKSIVSVVVAVDPVFSTEDVDIMANDEVICLQESFVSDANYVNSTATVLYVLPHCVRAVNLQVLQKLENNILLLNDTKEILRNSLTVKEKVEFNKKDTKNVSKLYRAFVDTVIVYRVETK